VASSLITLVGDYLFDDHMRQDRVKTDRFAVEAEGLYQTGQIVALQRLLESSGGELGGRLMVLDGSGKVQADSYAELLGARLELPEVISILTGQETAGYGVHKTEESAVGASLLQAFEPAALWVSCSSAALTQNGEITGVLLFSSPIQGMMARLLMLQERMVMYFLIAAAVSVVVALVFSRVITRPIAALTRSIQRMGRGDLSVRVPETGSGELKRLAHTFNAMSEKLELFDKSRNQFVSNASHELKTPLATMKILLESMIYQPEMELDLRSEFLTDVNKEIDRLNLIISDLLTLVSMDSKTMRLNRETVSLSQIVNDAIHRLAPVAERRHQEIKLHLSDNCEMYADSAKLIQVVYNLLDNALKYTQEGGVIRVRLVRSGRDAILTIADNGPGIPKTDQAHIFDRFYRVDKARGRDTGGTGLGLAIVHQMVLMHGGSVTVDSEEGNGAIFTIELPIHQG